MIRKYGLEVQGDRINDILEPLMIRTSLIYLLLQELLESSPYRAQISLLDPGRFRALLGDKFDVKMSLELLERQGAFNAGK